MQVNSRIIWGLRSGQARAFVKNMADVRPRVDRFNAIWRDAYVNVPFYADWKMHYGLPDKIQTLRELSAWPVLEKKTLMVNQDKFIRKDIARFNESVTGGSTGEPLHFRTMVGESDIVSMNKWIGWARMGILPDSRCFLLWGHRHGHGQGVASQLHFAWRKVKDWMTNNLRADATNLSFNALKRDVEKLIKFKPECVIAYSASLLALVRSCGGYKERCQELGVKAVICTAGPLAERERDEILCYFNAPVAMEYGSMEAGVMAYQTPMTGGRYIVFDKTHVLHILSEEGSLNNQILVTKLYPCYLPLIRYKIGDCIQGEVLDADDTVVVFDEVLGRTGDEVDMGGGIRFPGQSFMLCAEGYDKVIAYQLRVNRQNKRVKFVVQTNAPLIEEEKMGMRRQTADMSGLPVDAISVEESNDLEKAPSGKIRLVIDET